MYVCKKKRERRILHNFVLPAYTAQQEKTKYPKYLYFFSQLLLFIIIVVVISFSFRSYHLLLCVCCLAMSLFFCVCRFFFSSSFYLSLSIKWWHILKFVHILFFFFGSHFINIHIKITCTSYIICV